MTAWALPDNLFDAKAVDPWQAPMQPVEPPKPEFADNEALKTAFGIELAKGQDAFKAGMIIFNDEMPKALWVSFNWAHDPVVIASRDAYAKTLLKVQKPLDREELLSKILAFHDEKDVDGRPLVEAKERLNALRLYSEVSGFTGKIDINASTNTTNNTVNNNNLTKIVLVSGNKEDAKIVNQSPNTQSRIPNGNTPSIPLKLVSGVAR